LLAVSVLIGCGPSAPPDAAPAQAAGATAQPTTPAARLLAAARTPPVGAFRLGGVSQVTVGGETLSETTTVERSAAGTVHVRYANSRDEGRELFVEGSKLWIRPLYGKYHLRPLVEPAEAARLLDNGYGTLAAQLELVLPWAKLTEAGGKVTLALGGKPTQTTPGWRGTVIVDELGGELTVTEGAVTAGKLAARLRFTRDGKSHTMELSSEHLVTRGQPATLTVPIESESATSHEVSTEWRERVELLSGIAPPPKRGP
jgi:hypothetical protein